MFDGIAYSKGASVIAMANAYMNARAAGSFNAGLQAYLQQVCARRARGGGVGHRVVFRQYKYGNANSADLWTALSVAAGDAALPTRMATYTASAGVPLVSIGWADPSSEKTCNGALVVSQARYFRSAYSASLVGVARLW